MKTVHILNSETDVKNNIFKNIQLDYTIRIG